MYRSWVNVRVCVTNCETVLSRRTMSRPDGAEMIRLIRELVRPYRGSLLIILLAMMVETATSLATPWPLKIIIDNVVGSHKLSPWLADLLRPWMDGRHQLHIAALAAAAYVIIALLGALATYIDNY